MKDIIEIDFDEIANTYNQKGKGEAAKLAREKYNLSFQQVRRRMNNKSDYYFDSKLRLYKNKSVARIESNFMTIDELECHKLNQDLEKDLMPLSGLSITQSFEYLLNELIKDRLIELNKYVSIDLKKKQLIIHTKNLKRDCFQLIKI